MVEAILIALVIGIAVRFRYHTKKGAWEVVEGNMGAIGMVGKLKGIVKTDDVDVLEEDEWVWYKVRVKDKVYEVYMDDNDGDEIKSITYGTDVIYAKTVGKRLTRVGQLNKGEKKAWMK